MPSDRFRSEVGSTERAADPSPMSSVLDAREDTGLVQHTSDNRTESDEYPHPPLDANQENGRSSVRGTFFHILKGNIGTGLLGLPAAFAFAGLPFAIAGMGLICILAVHCMFLLTACAQCLRERTGKSDLHYAKVAELAVLGLPGRISRLSRVAKFIVNIFLVTTQLGLCCVYVLFVAANVQQVLAACGVDVEVHLLVVMSLLIYVPGTFVRKLQHLAPLSGVATIVQVLSIFVILGYLGTHTNIAEMRIAPFKPALFFGVAVFSLEGICLVLPLENDMAQREKFGSTLRAGMLVTCALYMLMGILGMMAYKQPLGSITLDLPHEGIPKNLPYIYVRLFYAFSIIATYFIQFYVPMAIMHRRATKIMGKRLEKFSPYILRVVFVGITAVIAVVVPQLDLAISLVGSFSSSALALIFPPLLELAVFRGQWTPWMVIKDVFISLVGFFGMVVGTYTTLQELAESK